jgi:hypothetical protein
VYLYIHSSISLHDVVLTYLSTDTTLLRSRVNAVGIATGYGLDDRGIGVRVPAGLGIFSSLRRPDRLWGPLLLFNGYRSEKLTTHLQLVPRSRKHGSIHPVPHTPAWHSA